VVEDRADVGAPLADDLDERALAAAAEGLGRAVDISA